MAFVKKFELKLYVPVTWEPAGDMPTRWRDNLKNAAGIMYDRLTAKIPDDGTYINEMSTPASKAYSPYVPGSFVSKRGRTAENIRNTHAKNMAKRFNRWFDNLAKSFAEVGGVPAKSFKEKVDAGEDNWATEMADKTLRLTGDKIRGRSVAPIATFYLIGDARSSGWIRPGDLADGTPYNITSELERNALKAAIQQRLVQGGMMVINSEYQPSVILEQNTINASLLTKLRDTAKCDAFVAVPAADTCYCAWEMADNLLVLHVQVGVTVP